MQSARGDLVREEYARLAGRYDRRWSSYIGATVRGTIGRMDVRPGDRVLDIGCGTGILLRALADAGPDLELTGIDLSPEMLAVARRRLPGRAPVLAGGADRLPFPDATFDVIVSTSAFHFFREPTRALGEIRRVLKPGGRLVITDWCRDYLSCRVCDLLLRCFNRAHLAAYRADECRALLEGAGFIGVAVERYKLNWLWGIMTARARKGSA